MSTVLTAPARPRSRYMTSAGNQTPLAVLDIGSSKVCCFIARPMRGKQFQVIGRGLQSSDGIRCGEIVDADAAEASVRAVLFEAEQQAGETIRDVVVVVAAGRPRSLLMRVERPLEGRRVCDDDIQRSLDRARYEVQLAGLAAVHLIQIESSIDGGRPLRDPRGIAGQRLELVVHAVAAEARPIRDILACLERCHLSVKGVVASALASGLGCLTEDELERGSLVIDVGGGATHLAHFVGGKLAFLDLIAKGGERITADVSIGLSTSRREAERIKTLYGGVLWRSCDDNIRIEVPLIGDHLDQPTGEEPRTKLTWIIRARVEEIFDDLIERLRNGGDILRAKPPKGIVLTGGASQIEGMDELAEEVFGMPVRIGRPRQIVNNNGVEDDPACSAAAGALMLLSDPESATSWSEFGEKRPLATGLMKVRRWFKQNF